jgi:hypothetical protein
MKPKLQLTPKNKVKVRASVRLAYVGATFAVLVATAFLIYYNLGDSEKSIANEQTYLNGFSKRAPLFISNDIIRGQELLKDFPVLINIKNDELKHVSKGGFVVNPKGLDIRITKADGISSLASQIESYNPNSGEVSLWVMIDSLSENYGRDLFLYYSNSTINSDLPAVIWSNGYQAIWHLNGNAFAANTRKIKTTAQGTSDTEGKISMSKKFSADRKDYLSCGYVKELDLQGSFTISTWLYLNELNKKQVILSNQGDLPQGYSMYINENNQLCADFYNASGKLIQFSDESDSEILDKERWYHVNIVFSSEEKKLTSYVDGIADRIATVIDVPHPSAAELQIGRNQFDKDSYFNGLLDEIRIANVPRSQLWLATVFYNESLADKLFSLGASEDLNLSAEAQKASKKAIMSLEDENLKNNSKNNTLNKTKSSGSAQVPGVLSNNAEVLQARLNNIKRVAEENN